MVPEQQQRILGYFIEEATDHLNTIEQGLLNLQATIGNPEMANEVFRAAHSVKGGAAMLGIESMQRTAHRMEDYFKLLKEAPIQVDRSLESMFLRVFDALQELLEQLQGPFGLTEDKEQSIMTGVEPVFQELQERLEQLVEETGPIAVEEAVLPATASAPAPQPIEESALKLVFSSDVSASLREMLSRFKQADTDDNRDALEACCRTLERYGEQFNLPTWMNLVTHARWAVCDRDNDYRTLAPVLIKEIKKAQDLVLAGREPEIAISETLQTLAAQGDITDPADDLDALFSGGDIGTATPSDIDDLSSDLTFDDTEPTETATDEAISIDDLLNDAANSPSGPEVGAAELTSLADLFETGGDTLDSDWQEEELPITEQPTSSAESLDLDIAPDFDDLLTNGMGESSNDFESGDELADLFGDTDSSDSADSLIADSDVSNIDQPKTSVATADDDLDALEGLFGEETSATAEEPTDDLLGLDLASNEADRESGDLFNGLEESTDNLFDEASSIDEESDDNLFGELAPSAIEEPTDDLFGDLDLAEDATENLFDDPEESADGSSNELNSSAAENPAENDLFDELDSATAEESAGDLFGELDSGEDATDDLLSSLESPADLFNESDSITSTSEADSPFNDVDSTATEETADDLFGDLDSTEDSSETDSLFDDVNSTATEETADNLFGDLDLAEDSNDSLFGSLEEAQSVETELGLDESLESGDLDNLFSSSEDEVSEEPVPDLGMTVDALDQSENELASNLDDVANATDNFFIDEPSATAADPNSSALDSEQSEFDDFFSVDETPSTPALELDSIEQDLWETDNESDSSHTGLDTSSTAARADDLSEDIWNESTSEGSTEELSLDAANLDQLNPEDVSSAAPSSDNVSDDLDLEDVWASVEEVSDDSDVASAAPFKSEPSSSDLELDDLFGDATEIPDLSNDTSRLETQDTPTVEDFSELTNDSADSESLLGSLFDDSPQSAAMTESADTAELDIEDIPEQTGSAEADELSFIDLELEPDPVPADNSELDASSDQSLSSDIDFDLLDLEDGGIVTGFVTEEDQLESTEDGLSLEAPDFSDILPGASSDTEVADAAETDIELGDLGFVESLDEPEVDVTEDLATTDDTSEDLPGISTSENALLDEQSFAAPELLDVAAGDDDIAAIADDSSDFDDLDALLQEPSAPPAAPVSMPSSDIDDEFGDLEALLQDADQTLAPAGGAHSYRPPTNRLSGRRVVTDQTMRVSVNHLDNLSNLVGELVVNRNTLEQDQERLRQFLDNLLFQVQQLNDVGQRMRDLYERSLLESSLMSSRQSYQVAKPGASVESVGREDHATGESFDALEMDRFTGFHTLSQEMIELIVRVRESASDIAYTVESSDQVTRQFRQVTNQLQEGLNKARMVPFAQTAARLPRAVRDISLKCGKEARLVVEGRDILIDKMILEQLYDPMTHLVNNAITHGIETPEERRRAGKPSEGVITVRAFYQGNQTVISVGDDGAGIDPEVVKQKALQKGLISQADAQVMTVLDVYDLLFHPGFSTRDQADDFAGRGFGMDVVRTSLADIRGNITIDSELGRGTNFTIRLPLTLSISKALSCISNQARIAFPMDGVEDMFDVSRERIQKNDQAQDCILWRDTLLPFQNLSDLLSFNRTLGRGRVYGGNQDENMISIVVLRSANSFIALEVDQVMGEQEIVIKQLEGPVPKPTGIAGATVLGDGRVMPIADVLELIDLAMGRVRREPNAAVWAQEVEEAPPEESGKVKSEPTVLIVDDSITVRELLSMSFNKVGYRVEQARDGQEAWEKLRSGLPCDLVFCDIEMPRMDGLELLSRLQKDGGLQQIPIAMLTSRGADRHRQMAVDLGASGYFTKPYLEEALLDAANKMLHGQKLV